RRGARSVPTHRGRRWRGGGGFPRHPPLPLPSSAVERAVLCPARVPHSGRDRVPARAARSARPRGTARHSHEGTGDHAARAAAGGRRAAAPPRALRRRVRSLQPVRALAPRRRPPGPAALRPSPGSDGRRAQGALAGIAARSRQHHLRRPLQRHGARDGAPRGARAPGPPARRSLAARRAALLAATLAGGLRLCGVRPPPSRLRRGRRELRPALGGRARPVPALTAAAAGLRRRGGDPRLPRRVSATPFYLPIADEVTVFTAAWQARLPVLLKGPTGC